MKKVVICMSVVVLFLWFGGIARAETFDFDRGLTYIWPAWVWDGTGLQPNANAEQISSYMTGVYGAPVTVAAVGSPVSNGIFENLLGGWTDGYLESEQQYIGAPHTIAISFSVPITSVSFDWARSSDYFYAEYSVNGTDFTNFFSSTSGATHGWESYDLPDNVIALKFHDSYLGEIGIDNLMVVKSESDPVPEPATLLLLGSGLLGMGVYARRRFYKK